MRIIAVSDVHASAGPSYQMLDQRGCDRFCSFALKVPLLGDSLVIVGDLFDLTYYPIFVVPPSDEDLMSDAGGQGKQVCDTLAEVSRSVPVHYVLGNHDDWVTPQAVEKFMPGVHYHGLTVYNDCSSGTHFEHGHDFALFNAPDLRIADYVPVGYFVSRYAATGDARNEGHSPTIQEEVRELVRVGTCKESITEALLDVMARKARIGDREPIHMPSYLWSGKATTPAEVKSKYQYLVSR